MLLLKPCLADDLSSSSPYILWALGRRISLDLLQKKGGSNSTSREFKRLVMNIIAQDSEHSHMPDYALSFDGDQVILRNRGTLQMWGNCPQGALLFLTQETYDKAREAAPEWDVYRLESEWREWIREKDMPKNPDKAFLGFCRQWFEKHGRPWIFITHICG